MEEKLCEKCNREYTGRDYIDSDSDKVCYNCYNDNRDIDNEGGLDIEED